MKKLKLFFAISPNAGAITLVRAEDMEEAVQLLKNSDFIIDHNANVYMIDDPEEEGNYAKGLSYVQLGNITTVRTSDYIKYVYDNIRQEEEIPMMV